MTEYFLYHLSTLVVGVLFGSWDLSNFFESFVILYYLRNGMFQFVIRMFV